MTVKPACAGMPPMDRILAMPRKGKPESPAAALARVRAKKLSPERRQEIARKAALARWSRAKKIKTTKKGW